MWWLKPGGMNLILHIFLEEKRSTFSPTTLQLVHENVKCFPVLFPEVYRIKELIKQLRLRRFNSPEKESVKNHAPIFVLFMIYDCKSLQGIFQQTGLGQCYEFHCKYGTREPKNPSKPHTTNLNFLLYPFVSHCSWTQLARTKCASSPGDVPASSCILYLHRQLTLRWVTVPWGHIFFCGLVDAKQSLVQGG